MVQVCCNKFQRTVFFCWDNSWKIKSNHSKRVKVTNTQSDSKLFPAELDVLMYKYLKQHKVCKTMLTPHSCNNGNRFYFILFFIFASFWFPLLCFQFISTSLCLISTVFLSLSIFLNTKSGWEWRTRATIHTNSSLLNYWKLSPPQRACLCVRACTRACVSPFRTAVRVAGLLQLTLSCTLHSEKLCIEWLQTLKFKTTLIPLKWEI